MERKTPDLRNASGADKSPGMRRLTGLGSVAEGFDKEDVLNGTRAEALNFVGNDGQTDNRQSGSLSCVTTTDHSPLATHHAFTHT